MTALARRAYGELDRERVINALHTLARRVGVPRVTMRGLAAELGAKAPSVYYHVPSKRAALDLLAESVLSTIHEPPPGRWDTRLVTMYGEARTVMIEVPGIANVLQTNGNGQRARRLDELSRALVADAGLTACSADAAHAVLYTYLLGSISLGESRPKPASRRSAKQAEARYLEGLHVIVEGIRTTAGRA